MIEFLSALLSNKSLHNCRLLTMADICRQVRPASLAVFTASGVFFAFNKYLTTSATENNFFSLLSNFLACKCNVF